MKKSLAVLLAILLCFGSAACTKRGTADPNASYQSEPLTLRYDFEITTLAEEAAQTGTVRAVNDATGETVWTYETEKSYVSELAGIQPIGVSIPGYLLIVNGTVVCLDPMTGKIAWTNDEFGGRSASWAFDNSASLYLCGYYAPQLFIVDAGGNTVSRWNDVFDNYDSLSDSGYGSGDFYWPSVLTVDEDGFVHITYDSNGQTLRIDPASGTVEECYPHTVGVTASFLSGYWTDDYITPGFRLFIADDLSFTLTKYGSDGAEPYTYYGRFRLDCYDPDHNPDTDWLCSELIETDDPVFREWSGIGDFVATNVYDGNGNTVLCLAQTNNGDSVFSYYSDNYNPWLYKVQ